MNENYIPSTDAGFCNWASVFAPQLTARPALYIMTAAKALAVQNAVDGFEAAYQIAIDPETRTKQTIIGKADARSIAESLCGQFAILIKENAGHYGRRQGERRRAAGESVSGAD